MPISYRLAAISKGDFSTPRFEGGQGGWAQSIARPWDPISCPLINKQKVDNYRPISLTSHISKILQSIIRYNIVSYLTQNDAIRNTHFLMNGRKHFLNEYPSMSTTVHNKDTDAIFLDLAKAFDKSPT